VVFAVRTMHFTDLHEIACCRPRLCGWRVCVRVCACVALRAMMN
jgi:hypothetical protein